MKSKLAIYMVDKKYQERFVKCLMNHYKDRYEIHVFETQEEMMSLENGDYKAFLTEGMTESQLEVLKKDKASLFMFVEEGSEADANEQFAYVNKYQEVYKIVEQIDTQTKYGGMEKQENYELIGVSSFSREVFQLPFAAMSAMICAEREPVLLFDLQSHSGLGETTLEKEEYLGMEDIMTVVNTGEFAKSRLLGAIGHEQKWDYIYPVKNMEYLAEANADVYVEMIDLLVKEQGYKKIIINFGTIFPGYMELMNRCKQIYCLTQKGEPCNWRERDFYRELKCRKKESLWNRFSKVELLSGSFLESDWKRLAQHWMWTGIGDRMREEFWMEHKNE